MTLVRECDRCGVKVQPGAAALQVSVLKADPATAQDAVAADVPVTLEIGTGGADLCPICRASALAELMVTILAGAGLTATQSQALLARLSAAVPLLVVADAPVVPVPVKLPPVN